MIIEYSIVTQIIINGLFSGIGAAFGAYIAHKTFINHLDRLLKKINGK